MGSSKRFKLTSARPVSARLAPVGPAPVPYRVVDAVAYTRAVSPVVTLGMYPYQERRPRP